MWISAAQLETKSNKGNIVQEDMTRFTQSELKIFVFVSLRSPEANTIFLKGLEEKFFPI